MSVEKLNDVILRQARTYRKGEVVTEKDEGVVHVVTIDAMPATPSRGVLVDVYFFNVGFTEHAADREGFLDALREATEAGGHGIYNSIDLERLAGGPSYIEVGAWLGSQELALTFFGLMEFHELGRVITPTSLGLSGDDADRLAGQGMVFCPLDRASVLA